MEDLLVIQKVYDLIKWYIPIINKLPKNHKFGLGDRITLFLYQLLEELIICRYSKDKIHLLENLNAKLDIIRHQTRLLRDFNLIDEDRYIYINLQLHEIGNQIGGWLKQQQQKPKVKLA